MKTSPLTLQQWQKLESLADAAHKALQGLEIELLTLSAVDCPVLSRQLSQQYDKLHSFSQTMLAGYHYHCQSEWLGGEAWKVVEPHVIGLRRTVL